MIRNYDDDDNDDKSDDVLTQAEGKWHHVCENVMKLTMLSG